MVSTACHSGSHCRIRKQNYCSGDHARTKALYRKSLAGTGGSCRLIRDLGVSGRSRTNFWQRTRDLLIATYYFEGAKQKCHEDLTTVLESLPGRLLVNTVDGQYRTDRRQLCHQLVERSRFIRHVTKPPYSRNPLRLMTHEIRAISSKRFLRIGRDLIHRARSCRIGQTAER